MSQHSKHSKPFRVASYNIRKCVGLDRKRSPERVLGVVADLDADVIALQEVDKRLGSRPTALPRHMIEAETDLKAVPIPAFGVSLGHHGNAVLIRKEMQVSHIQPIDLPGFEPRGALLVELGFGSREIRIVATHLGLMRRHRTNQLTRISAILDEKPPMPTLIVGDFNEWSTQRGLEPLQSAFNIHTPGNSFHAARPVAALDRIAASSELTLVDAGIQQSGEALVASDHLPIWADFSSNSWDAGTRLVVNQDNAKGNQSQRANNCHPDFFPKEQPAKYHAKYRRKKAV